MAFKSYLTAVISCELMMDDDDELYRKKTARKVSTFSDTKNLTEFYATTITYAPN